MPRTGVRYIVEYKPAHAYCYHCRASGFLDKEVAITVAEKYKEASPELGVRVIEQTRKVVKVY